MLRSAVRETRSLGSVRPIRLVVGVLDCRVADLMHEERWLSRAFDGRRRLIGAAGVPSISELFPGCRAAVTLERIYVSRARSRGFARCVARRADLLNEWQIAGDQGGHKARVRPQFFAISQVAGPRCVSSSSARTAPR